MSATMPAPARRTVRPHAGPLFRRAAALPVEGAKRRRVLALLAAFADAGEPSPRMTELAARLDLLPPAVDRLLEALVGAGWLTVEWAGHGPPGHRAGPPGRRNVYTLRLDGTP